MAGVEVDMVPVHLVRGGGEQHGDQYKSVNPMEQVPALVVDGEYVTSKQLTLIIIIFSFVNLSRHF